MSQNTDNIKKKTIVNTQNNNYRTLNPATKISIINKLLNVHVPNYRGYYQLSTYQLNISK